jgi:hypothetical protein
VVSGLQLTSNPQSQIDKQNQLHDQLPKLIRVWRPTFKSAALLQHSSNSAVNALLQQLEAAGKPCRVAMRQSTTIHLAYIQLLKALS